MINEVEMALVVDQFTSTVTGDFSVEDIQRQLAEAATRVLHVDGAGVMAPAGGELLRFVFATTGPSSELDLLQEELQNSPCTDAAGAGRTINIADLAVEGDWPEFQARALTVGLRAATTIPLRARGRTWGVLDLYRHRPVRLDDSELAAAQRLANLATSYLVVTADRDSARAAQAELAHRAMHDPLTGLPVRWVFLEQLTHALTRLHRNRGSNLAVLFLDIDGLKYVNDTYGHLADRLITTCVARASAALRPSDLLARMGGDEFVILLEDIHEVQDAIRVSTRILDGLAEPYRPDGEVMKPSASIGIALTNDPQATPAVLISHADTAMYAAKHAGRGGFMVFDPAAYARDRARMTSRETLTGELRTALRSGQLDLHYQPILDLARWEQERSSGEVRARRPVSSPWAVEALVRWAHPGLGMVAAGQFVPLAESSGLIVELGSWVLRTSLRQLAAWDRDFGAGAPARIFVNVSAVELAQPGLPDLVRTALSETGIAPGRLTLEITESGLFTEPSTVAGAVVALRALGCELAIDDFGTGYSSLSRLVEIPVSTLKVDQSFTRGVRTRPESAAVLSSLLLLGHSLSRTVVVEGVEDADTLAALSELGATHVQGYHLGRPADAATISAYLVRSDDRDR